MLELGAGLDAFAEGSLPQIFEDDGGGGGAYVRSEQERLERGRGSDSSTSRVSAATCVEGLVRKGLAGPRNGLAHAVEEAGARGLPGGGCFEGGRGGGEGLGLLLG